MVHNILGALYFENGDIEKSIQHFKKALELDRTYRAAKENLQKVYLSKGKEYVNASMYQAAIQILLDGIHTFPDKPEMHNSLGAAYTGAGFFQKAIDEYTKVLQMNPGFTLARINMASCYNNQGVNYAKSDMWDKAIVSYNQAMRFNPDMEEANKNLIAAYWGKAAKMSKAGKNAESIKAYQLYLERDPVSKEAYNNMGAVYFRMGDYKSAISAFETALRLDPKDSGLKVNLSIAHHKKGIDLLKKGNISPAIAAFKDGLKITPDDAGLCLSMAQAYQRLGDWDNVEFYINKAQRLDPDSDSTHKMMVAANIQRGNEFLLAKKYEKALEYYDRVPAGSAPSSLYNNTGYIYIMQGKMLAAIGEFDKVLAGNPKNEIAHQNLLNVEGRLGKTLSSNPNSQQVIYSMARVRLSLAKSHMGRGNLTEAKLSLKSAIDLNPRGNNLRKSLAAECKKLAEVFIKKKNGHKEAQELRGWAVRLNPY